MIGITIHLLTVTVEPFLFSPAEPVAYEWSYKVCEGILRGQQNVAPMQRVVIYRTAVDGSIGTFHRPFTGRLFDKVFVLGMLLMRISGRPHTCWRVPLDSEDGIIPPMF